MLKNYQRPKIVICDFSAMDILTMSVGTQNEDEGGAQGDFFVFK